MTARRTLRSNTSLYHCTAAVSRFPHGDHSSEENSLAEGPTAATATRKLAKKKEKRLHKSKGDPVSPLAKRARIETPKLQQKAFSKYSQDGSQMPTHLPNSEAELSSERPAEPHRTNAPLTTPKGSRLVTYNKETADASPSKTGLPRPTTTTSHILDEACAHLVKMEPKLQPLIEKHYCRVFCPEGLAEECDPFRSLCSSSELSFPSHFCLTSAAF